MSSTRAWFAALMLRLGFLYLTVSAMLLLHTFGNKLLLGSPGHLQFFIDAGLVITSIGLLVGTKWSPTDSEAPR